MRAIFIWIRSMGKIKIVYIKYLVLMPHIQSQPLFLTLRNVFVAYYQFTNKY